MVYSHNVAKPAGKAAWPEVVNPLDKNTNNPIQFNSVGRLFHYAGAPQSETSTHI